MTEATYQNAYGISTAFPLLYTIVLTLVAIGLIYYGVFLIWEDKEIDVLGALFSRK